MNNKQIQAIPMIEKTNYYILISELTALISTTNHWVTNCAQLSALLYQQLSAVNWVGFYFLQNTHLQLGPFQGQPACSSIALGKGVCGNAAQQQQSIIVDDVHNYNGHIACDSNSRSECVIPIIQQAKLVAVLDIDSPILSRFSEDDLKGLENIVQCLVAHTNFNPQMDY